MFVIVRIFLNIKIDVLISSIRQAKRLGDLTSEEVADFFQTAVKVQQAVEKAYSSSSSTICVQDGKDAGQSISVRYGSNNINGYVQLFRMLVA